MWRNMTADPALDWNAAMGRLLDLLDSLARIQTLGADLCTVHDCMTPVQLVGIIQLLDALLCEVVSAVNNPPAMQIMPLSVLI